ncbi:hydrogenase nickel incorporation protein HypB, partial [Rubrivirga sp.]|uniref:hydrogenase nickel incorporation protein HypB n=1 Tax=Rubrivirga sp. TaxID=1885344 RepID=UPI003C769F0F
MSTARIIDVRQKVLRKNDALAADLRARFADAGVFVVNLVSSPGSGKTALLERTLSELDLRAAVVVGDLATENDATRLAASGAPVRQISTGTTCHLEADMVEAALEGWDLSDLDVLFIENVGNLVCPASWDLGEAARVVLLSTTEGEDKPRKYPTIFNTADVAVLTKMDLEDVLGFDRVAAVASIWDVRPGLEVVDTSVRGEP